MGFAVLGLDLGASTGWALRHPDVRVTSGWWDLSPAKHQGEDWRYRILRARLTEVRQGLLMAGDDIGEVRYEGVDFLAKDNGPYAAHRWGGYEATVITWAGVLNIPYWRVGVSTLKKAATGNGHAKKPDVVRAINERLHLKVRDENEGDACALLLCRRAT